MTDLLRFSVLQDHPLMTTVVVFLAVIAGGLVLQTYLFRGLRQLTERTQTSIDDELLIALRWPFRLFFLFLAILVSIGKVSQLPIPDGARRGIVVLGVSLLFLSVAAALSAVTIVLLRYLVFQAQGGRRVTALTTTLIRVFWFLLALVAILNALGISIAPALAALGAGGLGLGLALKDTMANLFAGFHVSLGGNFHKGDYVRLNSGEEGVVEDIRWRLTSLRTMQNNLIIIPNARLAEAIVTNFSLPESKMSLAVPFTVGYGSDSGLVDRVLLEEAQAAMGEVDGLLPDAPLARFNGFGESALNFALIVQVRQFQDQFLVADQLRRRVLDRFRREGIDIPYPQRVLHMNDSGSGPKPQPLV